MELTVADVNILIEAVDAWVTSKQNASMLTGLFIGALVASGNKDENSTKGTDIAKKIMEKGKEGKEVREEQATMLKAKLLALRGKLEAVNTAREIAGA